MVLRVSSHFKYPKEYEILGETAKDRRKTSLMASERRVKVSQNEERRQKTTMSKDNKKDSQCMDERRRKAIESAGS